MDTAIKKSQGLECVLEDYDRVCAGFDWARARTSLLDAGGGVNLAGATVDRQVRAGRGGHPALRWLAEDGGRRTLSYAELQQGSDCFAHCLSELGVARGERVFCLLGRVPELYMTALGTWKYGAVFCPLFSAFGPEPIRARMAIAQPAVLVTSRMHYRRKIAALRAGSPFLRHVILVDSDGIESDAVPWPDWVARGAVPFACRDTAADELATLHFTSGTTGRPKAAMHVHEAVVSHRVTARYALDLRADDVYWCTADPGWVTGTSYGIVAPLAIGCTLIAEEAEFDAERWYRTLSEQAVSVWYTAPTAIRMLMKAGDDLPRRFDLSRLRFIASVGEPLNPEAVQWGRRVLGLPIHDNWWQTETGGIMVANYACMDIKPGSMGRPVPGIEAAIVRREGDRIVVVTEPDAQGELALRPGWPAMFRGYLGEEARYLACFADGWYLSGDLARRDADGYFWFVGRADDVIKSAGHLIGPFEVESALLEHPAVAEVGVIGIPDPVMSEAVKAFVALKPGVQESEALRRELLGHARKRLGPAVAPREIAFRAELPKTRSGKIMRRLLKARELGLPEGDLSTLERGA